MAPTPATTNIAYVDYSGPMGVRTMQMRIGDGYDISSFMAVVDPVLDAVVPLWYTSVSVIGVRFRAIGTTFSLPVASIPSYVGTASGTLSPFNYPRFLSLSGRGQLSGAEVRLFVYGASFTSPDDYRLTAAENTLVANLRAAWGGQGALGNLVTEQNDLFAARNYANVGYNSYYERKARG